MSFIRKIKKKNSVYLAEVENYREGGKVRQRVIRYIGKQHEGNVVRKVFTNEIEVESVKQYLDYKILHEIATRIGIVDLLGQYSKYILLLVYTQIASRKPLYKIPEYIEQTALREILRIEKIIDKNLYTALDELEELEFTPERDQVKLKNTKVYVKDFEFFEGKLIIVYNPEIEVSKRMEAMELSDYYNQGEAKYMGYSLIYHTTGLTNEEVVKAYYEKDIVEKAFKELKSSINLRPIRKYLLSHVKAHIKICYLAYAILSYIQWKLKDKGISAVSALEKLQPVYKVEMSSEKKEFHWSKIVTLSKEQSSILKIFNCSI